MITVLSWYAYLYINCTYSLLLVEEQELNSVIHNCCKSTEQEYLGQDVVLSQNYCNGPTWLVNKFRILLLIFDLLALNCSSGQFREYCCLLPEGKEVDDQYIEGYEAHDKYKVNTETNENIARNYSQKHYLWNVNWEKISSETIVDLFSEQLTGSVFNEPIMSRLLHAK